MSQCTRKEPDMFVNSLRQKQMELFQANIFHVIFAVQNGTRVSDSWLSDLERKEKLIIHIEDNGTPLLHGMHRQTIADADFLISSAKDYIEKNFRYQLEDSSPSQSPYFRLKGNRNDQYQAVYVSITDAGYYKDIIMLNDITVQSADEILRLSYFLLIELISLLCLFILGKKFVYRALAPVRENQKLQNEFIAAASHELRAPIMLIQTAASSALDFPSKTDYFHQLIKQECTRMNRLIKDLLALTASGNGATDEIDTKFDAEMLLLDIYEAYLPLGQARGLSLTIKIPDDLPIKVRSNPDYISQIIRIFMDNAIAFSPPEGSVILELSSNKKYAYFSVIDHGPGISDQDKKCIYQKFYRGDKSRTDKEHFGLGLSIAQKYTEQLQGNILLMDTLGGGSTFILKVPCIIG